ncbi:MAG: hypothetical protein HY288_12595 [Planctomycetia bacterium]|nr:hypothetical protein [Planctomycetia bacterium]
MSGVRIATAWFIGALLMAGGAAVAAEQLDARQATSPAAPRFRRIYIPAEQIQKGTWTEGYLPIDAKEFQWLIETAHASAAGAPSARAAQIEKAAYTAQLVGEDLLVGNSVWEIARGSDAASLLALDPCNLALGTAAWQDKGSRPAVLGAVADGHVRVLVEGSKLGCQWSLRGERTASGAVGFHIELPGCPMESLAIELPAGLDLIADQGIVSKATGATPEKTRWSVELGGHNRLNLRIVREGTARERRPLTLLRQSLTYEFSARGINLSAQLNLDIHGEPLQRIAVDLDSPLSLVAARYGELDVPWSTTTDVETHMSHVVLELPEAIVGTGRVLQLRAIAPLTSGKTWRLPGLQPEGMSWQEGTATLLIPNSLVLEQLSTEGCRQSRVAAVPAPSTGESIEIQYYRPGATMDVLLVQPREQLKVETGAVVEVGANEITARSAVVFSASRGERFVTRADVNAAWTIDAVEALGTNRVTEWELEEQQPSPTRLKLRLERAISAANPVRLLVRGHCPLPSGPVFQSQQLEMLSFDQLDVGTRLISVRAADGYELRWTGSEELRRHDPLELAPAELQLLPQPPNGLLFVEDSSFAQATVALQRRKPSYAADIRIDAAVQKNALTETYTIQCIPEAVRVERLVVRFSQARDVPFEWTLAGGSSGQLSARRLSVDDPAPLGLGAGGEVWELNLQLVRPGPFELRAVRTVPFGRETHLALASVAEATTEHGTLTIRALGDAGLAITNRRLTSVPAELLEADRYQTARATYQYQPARDDLGNEPAVSIAPAGPTQAESGAWVWSSRLDSRFAIDGTCVHLATFRLQTAGRQQIRVSLPAGANLQAAWVDEQRLPLVLTASDDSGFLVDLPPGRSFAALSLYYATADSLPHLVSISAPTFPLVDVPVVARQWSIWLPPGYEIRDAESRFPTEANLPLTWTERLFGVLGRAPRGGVFNPLAARDWRQFTAVGSEDQLSLKACEQFVQNLGTFVADYVNGEGESELTWGQLLASSGDAEAQLRRVLLIDGESLQWLGVTPRTRVRFQPGDSALDRGFALLRQANLVLIAQPNFIAVTSASSAASFASQLSPQSGVMFALSAGPLSDELQLVAQGRTWSHFEPVETWRAKPEPGQSPWTIPEVASLNVNETRGWNAYTFQFSESSMPQIRIVHTTAMRCLGWAVFLALVAIGIGIANRPPLAVVLVCMIGAFAALVLPAAYVPLASSTLLAGLFCLALRIIRHPEAEPKSNDPSRTRVPQTRGSGAQPVATLLLLAAIFNVGIALYGSQENVNRQAPPPPNPPRSVEAIGKPASATTGEPPRAAGTNRQEADAPLYRVFVQVDAQENPLGGKYYIPKEFYNQLSRQAANASGQPKDWLITRAHYQGSLSRDPVHKQLGLSQLKVSFDLHVFQSNLSVRIPFPREGAANLVVAVRLDGRAIPVAWNATGDELAIAAPGAGAYRVELDLQPSLQTDSTTAGFDLAIPPLANAVLELNLPRDAPAIELPAARGQIRLQKERGELQAQLGACNRLAVRWPVGIGMEAAAPNLEVEEFVWVKVRPGTTVLDAKFKYRIVAGRVRQIRLLTDPRLRLLPTIDAQSPVTAVHTIPGDPQKIDLELSRTVSDHVDVELSFLLTGTSGVGNLRLPRLESSGARMVKRWLAVSVDSALQYKEQAGEDSKPVGIPEFTATWGNSDSPPQAAYSIPRGEPMWVLATQPNEPHTTIEQTLAISFGRLSSLVQFDASLLTAPRDYLFQLQLKGPPGLSIEQVSLMEDDVERVARWSFDESGRITVFLTAPVTGKQQLALRGRLTVNETDALSVPQFEVASAEIKKSRLQLFRQPAVLTEVRTSNGISDLDASEFETPEGFGARIGGYLLDDPQAKPSVKLAPNVPKSRAVAMTSLSRDADHWIAETEYHLDVFDGLIDTLQFEIPSQWSEPYRLDPPTPFKLVPIPGEARRQMIVYPEAPIKDKYQLKLRGRVALSAGDRLRVPDILPLRNQQLERFVVLPQHLDLQQVTWETFGLSRAQLPAGFSVHGPNAQSQAVYQVAGDHFQASLKAVERASASAQVALADIHVVWQPDGHCQGVATFDLKPGGATSCVLQLPTACRLVHVSIENLPAMLVALGENRWRLGLGPPQLPQRVEVVYTSPAPGSASRRHFECPRLADLEVERTLWTVHGPLLSGIGQPRDSHWLVGAAHQQLTRLQSMAALVPLPAEVLGEHLPEEIARWYRPWKKRYAESRTLLKWELVADRRTATQSEEELEARKLDQIIGAVDQRFGSGTQSARQNSLADAPTELLASARANRLPAYYLVRGPSYDLELNYPQSVSDGWAGRLAAAFALVVLAAVAAFFLRGRQLPTFAPSLVIGAVGLTWWLLLAPSIVGLLALLATCWIELRARWRPSFH